jgi:hypothetical protein
VRDSLRSAQQSAWDVEHSVARFQARGDWRGVKLLTGEQSCHCGTSCCVTVIGSLRETALIVEAGLTGV